MIGVFVVLVLALACAALGMIVGIVDEVHKRPGSFRRAGSGLAMIASFAGLWMLLTPVEVTSFMQCSAPVLVVSGWVGNPLPMPSGCSGVMTAYAVSGLCTALAAPLLVFATRGRVN
ncbi:MAG TPA: hypothetical protein PKD84_05110 [Propionicimonas sp.]|nr:hypothetical protein [Propionicimonas sp.]